MENSPFLHLFVLFDTTVVLFIPSNPTDGWGPPTLGRAICFHQSVDSNANVFWKTFTETDKTTFNQMSGHLVTLSS